MIPAKHVFFIVDACYGGLALRNVVTVKRPQNMDDALLAELTRRDRKVRQVLSAGGKDQRVVDGGLFGHSVFTGHLIEALREADPYITADRVGLHVRERVARDSLDRNYRQTPQFGHLPGSTNSFVFMRHQAAQAGQVPKAHLVAIKEERIAHGLSYFKRSSTDKLRSRAILYQQLLEIDPSLRGARLSLGTCLYLLGDFRAALSSLERSLQDVPDISTRAEIADMIQNARSKTKIERTD